MSFPRFCSLDVHYFWVQFNPTWCLTTNYIVQTHFKKERFALNFLTPQNTSKFVIITEKKTHLVFFVFHFKQLWVLPYECRGLWAWILAVILSYSVSFKSHSIRVTFKICAVLGAQGICATGFKRTQGNQDCAKVTLLEWLMKLTLLEWHQVFRPYVDIDQGIYKLKLKVALNEKRKKLHGFSFSINMANFLKRFGGQKVERKPLFFEVWQKHIVPYILTHM